jgi:hypothetical protein
VEKFTLPESLAALSTADLAALEAQAVKAFGALQKIGPDDLSDANVAEMERLAGDIQTLRTEASGRTHAATARKDRAAAAAALVTASTTTPEEPAPEDEDDEDEDEEDEPEVETPPAEQQAAVVASAKTGRRVPSVRNAPKTPVAAPASNGVTLIAAADVPGFASGSVIPDMKGLAKAFSSRANGFPRKPVEGTYIRSGVASIERDFNDGLVDTNPEYEDIQELVAAAGNETRLPGGSLIAAGGWCAPSETLYDLCVTETADGLLQIPEFGVTRGGIRFTKGPDFSAIYEDAGFILTEAQVIAGTPKPCTEIECPPFEEVRMDVAGVCVKAPILTNAGYPELVQRWIEGTLIAQAHKESGEVISRMVDMADDAGTLTGGAGAGFDLLTGLEWLITTQKYRWRLNRSATLEVVAPFWALSIIRADIGIRQGRETFSVTDAEINAHFAAAGARVQWVYNWQDLNTTTDKCFADVPAEIQILAYPAGTFTKGVQDVISLDAVYDSTLLVQNMYTAVFAESGFLVANRCYDACTISVPTCILGAVGPVIDACLPLAVA